MNLKSAIEAGDVEAVRRLLAAKPDLANEPIEWSSGPDDVLRTRPLHFLCDKVFDRTITDERAAQLAKPLIEAGADIDDQNGDPLNAAASLGATEVGLVLLEAGARTNGRGLFAETALHWAANTGNVTLVRGLLDRGAPIDVKDERWDATPIAWALEGWGGNDAGGHREVVAMLAQAGSPIESEWLAEAQKHQRPDVLAALRGELPTP